MSWLTSEMRNDLQNEEMTQADDTIAPRGLHSNVRAQVAF